MNCFFIFLFPRHSFIRGRNRTETAEAELSVVAVEEVVAEEEGVMADQNWKL